MSDQKLKSRFADKQPIVNPVTKSTPINSPAYPVGRVITKQDLNRERNQVAMKKFWKAVGWILISPIYIPWYVTAKGTDMLLCAEEREGGWTVMLRMAFPTMAFLWLLTLMNAWVAMGVMTLLMFARLYLNKAKTTETMF
jgi:hypothetical protein